MEMFEGMDPVAWVFIGVAVVAAVGFGILLEVGTAVTRYLRHRERRREATAEERRQAVEQLVDSPGYGRHVAVDPDKTVPIPDGYRNAGSELHWYEGLPEVPPRPDDIGLVVAAERHDPAVARVVVAAVDVAQRDAAAALDAVRAGTEPPEPGDARADDDRPDDDPPAGGGPTRPETLVMPRYDWAHLNGIKLQEPGPWRAPIDWLQRIATRAVMVWHLDSRAGRVLYRLRLSLTRLWAYQVRYAAAGRHDALRLCRRSWLEIVDERGQAVGRTPPWFGCVPS